MKLGILGAGRMGANIARRLARAGHECIVHDVDAAALAGLAADGVDTASSLAALVETLAAPRTIWLMLPSGAVTGQAVDALADVLAPGDTLIDGGNSNFKLTVARAAALAERGIDMIDVGTSGGVHGLERGYCLMIGGRDEPVARHVPIFRSLAPGTGDIARTPARRATIAGGAEEGWLHCGPSGAGHYVKMIHNGIEYGMMQAFAEGFALLQTSPFDVDPGAVAEVWRRGSVVSSWLLDLTADALAETPDLAGYSAKVQDSGEGRWTVEAAIEQEVPAPVLTAALFERYRSRLEQSFADRLLSAMRYKFGGHIAPGSDPAGQ